MNIREKVKKAAEGSLLDEREIEVLADMYNTLRDAAKLGLENAEEEALKIGGVIWFLQGCGKIYDDEDLWMLMNEIEAEG